MMTAPIRAPSQLRRPPRTTIVSAGGCQGRSRRRWEATKPSVIHVHRAGGAADNAARHDGRTAAQRPASIPIDAAQAGDRFAASSGRAADTSPFAWPPLIAMAIRHTTREAQGSGRVGHPRNRPELAPGDASQVACQPRPGSARTIRRDHPQVQARDPADQHRHDAPDHPPRRPLRSTARPLPR